jgi:multidrug efflux pump subunit AcrA (membrane-fusion protein)
MQELRKKKSVPQFEADKAQTEYALAKLELAKSREIRIMARANLEMERSQLALRTILSPIDGIVVDRYAMVGESVEGRSILKLAQVNPLKVEVIAPTEYFGLIRRGMQVDVYPEQPANKVFKATVTIVDKLIDPASGSFTVRMSLPNPDDILIGGVNCIAQFAFKSPAPGRELYSSVPSAALVD